MEFEWRLIWPSWTGSVPVWFSLCWWSCDSLRLCQSFSLRLFKMFDICDEHKWLMTSQSRTVNKNLFISSLGRTHLQLQPHFTKLIHLQSPVLSTSLHPWSHPFFGFSQPIALHKLLTQLLYCQCLFWYNNKREMEQSCRNSENISKIY